MLRVGWRLLIAAVMTAGALGVAHGAAPTALAECDGGLVFGATAPHARAAVVGRVEAFTTGEFGFRFVTAVRVDRAYGVSPGAVYRGRTETGWCADFVRVGSRVVLLLGVDLPGKQLDGDYYYVVGESVTAAEAAAVGSTLPDTATVDPPTAPPEPPLWALVAVGLVSSLLLLGLQWRRGATR